MRQKRDKYYRGWNCKKKLKRERKRDGEGLDRRKNTRKNNQ